ncbi:hypothetical protein CFP56_004841, partial [Quercus suber]
PFPILVTALPGYYWITGSSPLVTNSISTPHSVKFDDGSFVRIILASDLEGYYACHYGFFCNPTCNGYLFSIFSLYYVDGNISKSEAPRLVWIANPENPVSVNARQQLISQGGLYSLSFNSEGLFSYINSNPPQRYYSNDPFCKGEDHVNFHYRILTNRGMTLISRIEGLYSLNINFCVPLGIFLLYMRFELDGHLREEPDLLREFIGVCNFPMACDKYGICTNDQCSCHPPINGTNYFRQTNNKLPNNGYSLVTPLSCEDSKYHVLSELENTTYFPMDIP